MQQAAKEVTLRQRKATKATEAAAAAVNTLEQAQRTRKLTQDESCQLQRQIDEAQGAEQEALELFKCAKEKQSSWVATRTFLNRQDKYLGKMEVRYYLDNMK